VSWADRRSGSREFHTERTDMEEACDDGDDDDDDDEGDDVYDVDDYHDKTGQLPNQKTLRAPKR